VKTDGDRSQGVQGKPMTRPATQEGFQTLVEEHKKILYKVCNSYCRNRDDREDLAQEIIIQLWQSFGKFDERCRFSTWMYRIALNVAISFYRRESTRTRHVISDEEHLLEAIDDADSQPEDIRLLYQFIEGLDPLNKALVLLYLDGNSYQEIADVLGISETNVATKINRLKKTMKQEFSGTGRPEKGARYGGNGRSQKDMG
jgi:RNA polymerase sigma factor (sigma-70 family)